MAAVNVTLFSFHSLLRRPAYMLQQSIDVACLRGAQQQTHHTLLQQSIA